MNPILHVTPERLRSMPLPQPKAGSKDERGAALVVAGSSELAGAAVLAGVSALRAGAGKLKIATAGSVARHLSVVVPEAMVVGLTNSADGGFDHRAATERLLPLAGKCDALLIGSGMMEHEPTTLLTLALIAAVTTGAVVLDAAALCGLGPHADAVRACRGKVVITPHAGEMAQLLERKREEIEADPLDAARTAAEMLGATVVMKGAKTHVVGPEGGTWLYEGGGVGLATSGSGDVLAGVIAGLLARGTPPETAALWGVYLHGEAGSRLARSCGPLGFLARELPGEVPPLLRDLGPGGL